MKTLILFLALSSTSLFATRFEFVPSLGERASQGAQGSAFIETTAPIGQDIPIVDAIASFQFRGFDSGTNGFYPDLPNILAPLWDSLDGFTFFGTMTWNLSSLTGFWSMTSPSIDAPLHDPPLLGGTYYRLGNHTLESSWPLEYFFNQASLSGTWESVPDTGPTLVMLLGIIFAMFYAKRELETM